jgi:hypothetical protein
MEAERRPVTVLFADMVGFRVGRFLPRALREARPPGWSKGLTCQHCHRQTLVAIYQIALCQHCGAVMRWLSSHRVEYDAATRLPWRPAATNTIDEFGRAFVRRQEKKTGRRLCLAPHTTRGAQRPKTPLSSGKRLADEHAAGCTARGMAATPQRKQ